MPSVTSLRAAASPSCSCCCWLLCNSPAGALDLFATHEVTVQFATADGKPMADAEVSVFAPGDLTHAVKTGQTDKDGKFEFGTDRDGLWTAEARSGGEIARATVRVGGDAERGARAAVAVLGDRRARGAAGDRGRGTGFCARAARRRG